MKPIILFLFFAFANGMLQAQTPVAYYPFNGNANDAAGSNNGTVNGATLTEDRNGNPNSAYLFDGVDDFIDFASVWTTATNNFTITAWVKPLDNDQNHGAVVCNGRNDSPVPIGSGGIYNGYIILAHSSLFRADFSGVQVLDNAGIQNNKWQHIAFVRNAGVAKFYVNGVEVGSFNSTSNPKTPSGGARIGEVNNAESVPESWDASFGGSIDEVKIYNTPLTAAEIQAEYDASKPSLVAYYPFNGNANDESGYNNHGTVNGATLTTDRLGNANSAYSFDGNNEFISVADNGSLSPANVTVEAWIKVNAFTSTKIGNNTDYQYIVMKHNSRSTVPIEGYSLALNDNEHRITAVAFSSSGTLAVAYSAENSIELNKWYHIALVAESNSSIKLYINGALIMTTSMAFPLDYGSQPVQIGRSGNISTPEWDGFFNGSIDEVKIYNVALTPSEVQAEYENSAASVENYTVTTVAVPVAGGTTTGDGTYAYNKKVTAKATPNFGYVFVNWTDADGNVVSTDKAYKFNITGNVDLTANFAPKNFEVITKAKPGADGTTTGGGTYAYDSEATVTASANEGYEFVNWTDVDGNVVSASESYSFTVSGKAKLTANFVKATLTVTISSSPAEGGTTTGDGIYGYNKKVTAKATPNFGYVFVNWTDADGNEVSTDKAYKFNITGNVDLVANFAPKEFEVITKAKPGADGTTTGDGTYAYDSEVTVTASANEGYEFVNWTDIDGNVVSTSESYSFTVSGKAKLTANFVKATLTVTISSSPAEGGTTTGDGTYGYNKKVTAKATPNFGYVFVNWTDADGNEVSTDKAYKFNITGNVDLVANFAPKDYEVITKAKPAAGGTTTGGGTYAYDSEATVTAMANENYIFVNWTDADGNELSFEPSYSFTVTGKTKVFANFVKNVGGNVFEKEIESDAFSFNYYPNPVKDIVYINANSSVQSVEVYNLANQKVMSLNASKAANAKVDVRALPQGVYVFRVAFDNGEVKTFKIVKK